MNKNSTIMYASLDQRGDASSGFVSPPSLVRLDFRRRNIHSEKPSSPVQPYLRKQEQKTSQKSARRKLKLGLPELKSDIFPQRINLDAKPDSISRLSEQLDKISRELDEYKDECHSSSSTVTTNVDSSSSSSSVTNIQNDRNCCQDNHRKQKQNLEASKPAEKRDCLYSKTECHLPDQPKKSSKELSKLKGCGKQISSTADGKRRNRRGIEFVGTIITCGRTVRNDAITVPSYISFRPLSPPKQHEPSTFTIQGTRWVHSAQSAPFLELNIRRKSPRD